MTTMMPPPPPEAATWNNSNNSNSNTQMNPRDMQRLQLQSIIFNGYQFLRTLENFARVSFPEHFPPAAAVGTFPPAGGMPPAHPPASVAAAAPKRPMATTHATDASPPASKRRRRGRRRLVVEGSNEETQDNNNNHNAESEIENHVATNADETSDDDDDGMEDSTSPIVQYCAQTGELQHFFKTLKEAAQAYVKANNDNNKTDNITLTAAREGIQSVLTGQRSFYGDFYFRREGDDLNQPLPISFPIEGWIEDKISRALADAIQDDDDDDKKGNILQFCATTASLEGTFTSAAEAAKSLVQDHPEAYSLGGAKQGILRSLNSGSKFYKYHYRHPEFPKGKDPEAIAAAQHRAAVKAAAKKSKNDNADDDTAPGKRSADNNKKKKKSWGRSVYAFDATTGKYLGAFDSVPLAAQSLVAEQDNDAEEINWSVAHRCINYVCNGKLYSYKKIHFRWQNDPRPMIYFPTSKNRIVKKRGPYKKKYGGKPPPSKSSRTSDNDDDDDMAQNDQTTAAANETAPPLVPHNDDDDNGNDDDDDASKDSNVQIEHVETTDEV